MIGSQAFAPEIRCERYCTMYAVARDFIGAKCRLSAITTFGLVIVRHSVASLGVEGPAEPPKITRIQLKCGQMSDAGH